MDDAASHQGAHTMHLTWAIQFSEMDDQSFGSEGPEQVRHRFYEFVRDSNHQGKDLAPYHFRNLTGPPEKFLKAIDSERMESARRMFRHVLTEAAKQEDGNISLTLRVKMLLRPVISLQPFQIVIEAKDGDPIELALWLHIVFSRQEGDRIRKCENEDCGRIFLREGKKPKTGDRAYCSTSCTRAAVTKRYLAKRKAKKEATAAGSRKK